MRKKVFIDGKPLIALVKENGPEEKQVIIAPGEFKIGDKVEGIGDKPLKIETVINPDLPAIKRMEEKISDLKHEVNRSLGQRQRPDNNKLKELRYWESLLPTLGKIKHLILVPAD